MKNSSTNSKKTAFLEPGESTTMYHAILTSPKSVISECEIRIPNSMTNEEKLYIAGTRLKKELYVYIEPIGESND